MYNLEFTWYFVNFAMQLCLCTVPFSTILAVNGIFVGRFLYVLEFVYINKFSSRLI